MKYNKNLNLRIKYLNKENHYIFIKYILYKFFKKRIKFLKKFNYILIYLYLKKMSKFKIFRKNIKNICILSTRQKSVYRHYKISRIELRCLSSNKSIPGFFKKSW